MTSQFGDERVEQPNGEPTSSKANQPASSSDDELQVPSADYNPEVEPLSVDGIRSRISSALTREDSQTEIELRSHLLRPFIGADGATPDQLITLEALLHSAYAYFRAPEATEAFLSVMEVARAAISFWYIPRPEFDEIRLRWFGLIDTLLQHERCDIGEALTSGDELRLMATAQLLGVAKRIIEIDAEHSNLDTNDLTFVVAEGCRAITHYLEHSEISPTVSDLVWLTVGELSDIAGLLAHTSLDAPLLTLCKRAIVLAGYEEAFLPKVVEEDQEEENDDDPDFSESLGLQFKEQDDEGLEEEDLELELDPDEEFEEVPEEELGTESIPLADMPIFHVDSIPNAEFGVSRLLLALAKCQPRIPGNVEREHLWSCAMSAFSFEHPSWNAGVLGMWIANEERAKGAIRSLLLTVFNWDADEWEGENDKEELPDEGDTFALLVELLAHEPQTAEGLEEVLRELPREVQISISDICKDALDRGEIPAQWFDAGCRDVDKFEAEIARIFIVS